MFSTWIGVLVTAIRRSKTIIAHDTTIPVIITTEAKNDIDLLDSALALDLSPMGPLGVVNSRGAPVRLTPVREMEGAPMGYRLTTPTKSAYNAQLNVLYV